MNKSKVYYTQIARLIFVLFSLYLVRDALYRWDGFSVNASFIDFIPSIALITILWSTIALIVATLIWLLFRVGEWICMRIGFKVRMDYVLTCLCFFILLLIMFWVIKRFIMSDTPLFPVLKWLLVLSMFLGSIFLTWKFRDNPSAVYERITPLVWLFGFIAVLSVPIVIYHTWLKQADASVIKEKVQFTGVNKDRPNIILVTFDALTARDMSVYGYVRPTTPFISEWSKNSILFTNAHAESNVTRATNTSLMTGKRVWTHRTYHNINAYEDKSSSTENLGTELKKNGYYTMAFTQNGWANVDKLGVADGFDMYLRDIDLIYPRGQKKIHAFISHIFKNKIRFDNWIVQEDFILTDFVKIFFRDYKETAYPAEVPFNKFLSSLEVNHEKPFFAWIHLMPPHDPYLVPEPFMGMFDPSPKLRMFKTHDVIIEQNQNGSSMSEEFIANVDTLRGRYDEFIRYSDSKFKYFIDQMQSRNLLGNTIVILSADHGESFEHNYPFHGGLHLYEQVTHIPLIIKMPDQKEGKIIHDLVDQVDIPATILDFAQTELPSWIEGSSLIPTMRGESQLLRPTFSMALYENSGGGEITKGTVAIWENQYKLVHYLGKYESLLFNLKQDPDEMDNLIDKEHETGQHLLGLIKENLKKANDRIRTGQ